MSTVEKALSVLDLFSESRKTVGLSEAARLLNRDKSTVQRYMADLCSCGYLEQEPRSRTYYLGAAITRLAMVREKTHPAAQEVEAILTELVDQTGESAHASIISNKALRQLAIVDSIKKGTRVYIDPSEVLPFHATASGIAFLSASTTDTIDSALDDISKTYTPNTLTDRNAILEQVASARENGYAVVAGTFESDVVGMAAPLLGGDRQAVGAVAIAMPISRFSQSVEQGAAPQLLEAARNISVYYGAT